jgi:hypothetical protein
MNGILYFFPLPFTGTIASLNAVLKLKAFFSAIFPSFFFIASSAKLIF